MKLIKRERMKGKRTMRDCVVTLRFTDEDGAGVALRPYQAVDCDYSEGVLKTVPEWEPVLRSSGKQYQCNLNNALEVGGRKIDNGEGGYDEVYFITSRTGSIYLYRKDADAFYCVVVNRGRLEYIPVKSLDGQQLLYFTDEGFLWGDTSWSYNEILSDDTLAAGAFFKHRAFVAMKNGGIRYSVPEDFSDFSESSDDGGFIQFPNCGGDIISMKVFEDALYVFFQNGIMRLTVGGDPSNFYSEKLDYTGGDIFYRTICVCQHAIYFLARGGMYRLKGKKTERLPLKAVFPTVETGLEGCAVWQDRPMIRYQEADGTFKTIVVARDGKSAFFMSGLNLLGRSDDGSALFTDHMNGLCRLVEKGTKWYNGSFLAEETDFGVAGKKLLCGLRFRGEGTFTLTMKVNGRTVTREMAFENGVAEWKMAERGERFAFGFSLGRASKIAEMQATFKRRI